MLFFQLPMFAIIGAYCACCAEEQGVRWYHSQLHFCLCHLSLTGYFSSTNSANWWGYCCPHRWALMNHWMQQHWPFLQLRVVKSVFHPCSTSSPSSRCTTATHCHSTCSKSGYSFPSLANQVLEMTATYPPSEPWTLRGKTVWKIIQKGKIVLLFLKKIVEQS